MAEKKQDKGSRQRSGSQREARLDVTRGVFMISVAAELADMHPQTLRMYEARGLITPQRSPKNTRLYSQRDVSRLRRIQRMTTEDGLNLAGVETVLELERTVKRMRAEMERMRRRAAELEQRLEGEVERVRRSLKAEIVPYGVYDVIPAEETKSVRIPVRRQRQAGSGDGAPSR
jgi:MerR family transcriptional regulator/heat shock protein HspR